MGEGIVGGRIGRGCGRPVGGGCVWESDKRFSVDGGVELGSTRSFCLVSLLESRHLRLRRLQLTGAGLPARYRIFEPG